MLTIAPAVDDRRTPKKRKQNVWEYVDFTPWQHAVLKHIAKSLGVTLAGAVEYALESQLFPCVCLVGFFGSQIEVSPGSRLTREELWVTYLEWCRKYRLGKISADNFATLAHLVCQMKRIPVRVRGDQVVCVDVRLKPDGGEKDA